MTIAVKDTHFYIVDDWGSFESKPEYKAENLCGIGLYTSDELSETHIPVGMGSKEELTRTLESYAEILKDTTAKLWKRFAGYSREQLMDAGALTYYNIIKDFAHVAACYEADDWNKIDERADRFRVASRIVAPASRILDLPEQTAILAFHRIDQAFQPVRVVAPPYLHAWQTGLVPHHAEWFRHRHRSPAGGAIGVVLDQPIRHPSRGRGEQTHRRVGDSVAQPFARQLERGE